MKNLIYALILFSIVILPEVSTSEQKTAGEQRTVGLFRNEPGAFNGYTLFSPRHYNGTFLIDMQGKLVHQWKTDRRVEHAVLLESSLLLRSINLLHPTYRRLPATHGRIEIVDWDGAVVWSFTYANEEHILHHDFIPLPNGNILMSSYDAKTKAEVIAAGRNPATVPERGLLVERILEVKPAGKKGGEIVWSWTAWDHLVQDFDKTKPNYGKLSNFPRRFNLNYFRVPSADWNHVNGLDYNAKRDEILISWHINDEIIIIDHSTTTQEAASSKGGRHGQGGDILYRFGNPQTYGQGGPSDKHYIALHNAHWILEGLTDAGKIMVLNNVFTGKNSIVEILDVPLSNDRYMIPVNGKSAGVPQIKAVFDQFHTGNMGSAQRLPNGNTLIDDAVHGRFIEVTPAKKVVWEYVNPVVKKGPLWKAAVIPVNFSGDQMNECFEVARIAPDFPGLKGKKLIGKGPLEILTPPVNPQKKDLTVEQQKKYDGILAEYGEKRRDAFFNSGGDRQKLRLTMMRIGMKQHREMQKILNDVQFREYMKKMIEQRRQRGR
jgi:hypothetical protein